MCVCVRVGGAYTLHTLLVGLSGQKKTSQPARYKHSSQKVFYSKRKRVYESEKGKIHSRLKAYRTPTCRFKINRLLKFF